jgi:membrane protein DedA with SNARE-associated domain
VLGGFLSEDGATITAATLTISSSLNPKIAFFSAFVGLWIGDLGVYALARKLGPTILESSRFRRWFGSQQRSGSKAKGDGRLGLALSRFFPGTRVPAYISAGLGRMPATVFAGITAISALLWVVLVFAVIHLAPTHVAAARHRLSAVGLFALALFGLLHIWRKWGLAIRDRGAIAIRRIIKWEFWPAWLFYAPVAAMCAWLGIRYRGFALPAVANLNQKNGGIIGESKIEILRELMRTSPEFTADAFLVADGALDERLRTMQTIYKREGFRFPLVLKPNVAQRGAGFRKIHSLQNAEEYLSQVSEPVVVQHYVEGPQEAGIFYYRFPHEVSGHIFGITRKKFPVVTGDGRHSLKELIHQDPRARLMAMTYLSRLGTKSSRVLPAGEQLRLVEAGNHCQGCIFTDGWDLYSEALRATIDTISRKLPGFFIGRYDVRYERDEDLCAGKGFIILELNGAASEATNIYDERNSLWSAYATLYRQWELVYRIGALNRDRGHHPPTPAMIFTDWCEFSRRAVEYPVAD